MGEQEGTEIPPLAHLITPNLVSCGPKGDQNGWPGDSAGSSQDCTEHALGECVYAGVALTSRSLCHLPVVGARRLDRGQGSRSPRLSGLRRVFLTSQPQASDLQIPPPQGPGAPLLHSSFQRALGTSHAELSDPQDPGPAHAGILVSGFNAVPRPKC